MLLSNQALKLSPFCFSLKCPIWGWGLRVGRRERAAQQLGPSGAAGCYLIPEQLDLYSEWETAGSAPSHRTQSCVSPPHLPCLHLGYPLPGNLPMQTEVKMSALVHKETDCSKCGVMGLWSLKDTGSAHLCWYNGEDIPS